MKHFLSYSIILSFFVSTTSLFGMELSKPAAQTGSKPAAAQSQAKPAAAEKKDSVITFIKWVLKNKEEKEWYDHFLPLMEQVAERNQLEKLDQMAEILLETVSKRGFMLRATGPAFFSVVKKLSNKYPVLSLGEKTKALIFKTLYRQLAKKYERAVTTKTALDYKSVSSFAGFVHETLNDEEEKDWIAIFSDLLSHLAEQNQSEKIDKVSEILLKAMKAGQFKDNATVPAFYMLLRSLGKTYSVLSFKNTNSVLTFKAFYGELAKIYEQKMNVAAYTTSQLQKRSEVLESEPDQLSQSEASESDPDMWDESSATEKSAPPNRPGRRQSDSDNSIKSASSVAEKKATKAQTGQAAAQTSPEIERRALEEASRCLICLDKYDQKEKVKILLACAESPVPHHVCQDCLNVVASLPTYLRACQQCKSSLTINGMKLENKAGNITLTTELFDVNGLSKDALDKIIEALISLRGRPAEVQAVATPEAQEAADTATAIDQSKASPKDAKKEDDNEELLDWVETESDKSETSTSSEPAAQPSSTGRAPEDSGKSASSKVETGINPGPALLKPRSHKPASPRPAGQSSQNQTPSPTSKGSGKSGSPAADKEQKAETGINPGQAILKPRSHKPASPKPAAPSGQNQSPSPASKGSDKGGSPTVTADKEQKAETGVNPGQAILKPSTHKPALPKPAAPSGQNQSPSPASKGSGKGGSPTVTDDKKQKPETDNNAGPSNLQREQQPWQFGDSSDGSDKSAHDVTAERQSTDVAREGEQKAIEEASHCKVCRETYDTQSANDRKRVKIVLACGSNSEEHHVCQECALKNLIGGACPVCNKDLRINDMRLARTNTSGASDYTIDTQSLNMNTVSDQTHKQLIRLLLALKGAPAQAPAPASASAISFEKEKKQRDKEGRAEDERKAKEKADKRKHKDARKVNEESIIQQLTQRAELAETRAQQAEARAKQIEASVRPAPEPAPTPALPIVIGPDPEIAHLTRRAQLAEEKAQQEANLRKVAEAKAQQEAEARKLAEGKASQEIQKALDQAVDARKLAEAKFQQEETARKQAEAKVTQEADARKLAEVKFQQEADAKGLAEGKSQQEAQKALDAEKKALQEAEARKLAEIKFQREETARKQADAKAQQEETAKKQAEEKAQQEAQKALDAEKRALQEAEARKQADAKTLQEEVARKQAEEKAKQEAQKALDAEKKALQEAEARKLAEAKAQQEADMRKLAEGKAPQEIQKSLDAEKRALQEAEARKLAEAKAQQEETAKKQAEEKAKQEAQKALDAEKRALQEAEARKLAEAKAQQEETAKKQAEEKAKQEAQKALDAEKRALQEAEARKLAETKLQKEETARKQAEEKLQKNSQGGQQITREDAPKEQARKLLILAQLQKLRQQTNNTKVSDPLYIAALKKLEEAEIEYAEILDSLEEVRANYENALSQRKKAQQQLASMATGDNIQKGLLDEAYANLHNALTYEKVMVDYLSNILDEAEEARLMLEAAQIKVECMGGEAAASTAASKMSQEERKSIERLGITGLEYSTAWVNWSRAFAEHTQSYKQKMIAELEEETKKNQDSVRAKVKKHLLESLGKNFIEEDVILGVLRDAKKQNELLKKAASTALNIYESLGKIREQKEKDAHTSLLLHALKIVQTAAETTQEVYSAVIARIEEEERYNSVLLGKFVGNALTDQEHALIKSKRDEIAKKKQECQNAHDHANSIINTLKSVPTKEKLPEFLSKIIGK